MDPPNKEGGDCVRQSPQLLVRPVSSEDRTPSNLRFGTIESRPAKYVPHDGLYKPPPRESIASSGLAARADFFVRTTRILAARTLAQIKPVPMSLDRIQAELDKRLKSSVVPLDYMRIETRDLLDPELDVFPKELFRPELDSIASDLPAVAAAFEKAFGPPEKLSHVLELFTPFVGRSFKCGCGSMTTFYIKRHVESINAYMLCNCISGVALKEHGHSSHSLFVLLRKLCSFTVPDFPYLEVARQEFKLAYFDRGPEFDGVRWERVMVRLLGGSKGLSLGLALSFEPYLNDVDPLARWEERFRNDVRFRRTLAPHVLLCAHASVSWDVPNLFSPFLWEGVRVLMDYQDVGGFQVYVDDAPLFSQIVTSLSMLGCYPVRTFDGLPFKYYYRVDDPYQHEVWPDGNYGKLPFGLKIGIGCSPPPLSYTRKLGYAFPRPKHQAYITIDERDGQVVEVYETNYRTTKVNQLMLSEFVTILRLFYHIPTGVLIVLPRSGLNTGVYIYNLLVRMCCGCTPPDILIWGSDGVAAAQTTGVRYVGPVFPHVNGHVVSRVSNSYTFPFYSSSAPRYKIVLSTRGDSMPNDTYPLANYGEMMSFTREISSNPAMSRGDYEERIRKRKVIGKEDEELE